MSRMIQYPELWHFFCQTQQSEIEFLWSKGNQKNKNKRDHLIKRWKPSKTQVERVWKGILIGDEELEELRLKLGRGEEEKDIPVYGGAEVSENMKAVLKLPPGMTTFEELDDIKFTEDLEAMMIKQRWEERSKEERDGEEWTEE